MTFESSYNYYSVEYSARFYSEPSGREELFVFGVCADTAYFDFLFTHSTLDKLHAVGLPQVNVPFCAAIGCWIAPGYALHAESLLLKSLVHLIADLKGFQ